MIRYVKGDITNVKTGIIAHGVNCQGEMGAGVALAIKNKWPAVYDAYIRNTPTKGLEHQYLGSCHIIRVNEALWVANCYTQVNFGRDGVYADPDAIYRSMAFVYNHAMSTKQDVHTVKIGSKRGGLDWDTQVLPVFERLNSEYDVLTTIYDI